MFGDKTMLMLYCGINAPNNVELGKESAWSIHVIERRRRGRRFGIIPILNREIFISFLSLHA